MSGRSIIFRWDLDKTYLVSHFESLRRLLRVPFEKAEDKVAVPGVGPVIKGLRRTVAAAGDTALVYFLSASPPQIGAAIRAKLELDGIEYDGITFKNQMAHLMRGRFDALREQVGYKLTMLLEGALDLGPDSREYLFGDDWESDPFVYSLYADIIARRVDGARIDDVLERAGVHRHYTAPIAELLTRLGKRPRRHRVGAIFILRQRPVSSASLEAFGPRLGWFDNYFECSLRLYAMGLLEAAAVVEVAADVGLTPRELAASYDAADGRCGVERSRLGAVRRRLLRAGLLDPVRRGSPLGAAAAAARRLCGLPPAPLLRATVAPRYLALADRWSHRAAKERDGEE